MRTAAALVGLSLSVCLAPPALRAADAPAQSAMLGIWVPDKPPTTLLTAEGKPPALTEQGARLYSAHKAEAGKPQPQFDRTRWCAGPGMPRAMFMPYPLEIKADRGYVAILFGWYRWYRLIDLSGAEPDILLPTTMGYSVGKWEGDTLVVRTTGLGPETVLDPSGLPHSDEMALTERFRMLPGNRLEVRFTIEDAATYSQPWETVMTYHRQPGARVADDLCPDRIARGEPAVAGAGK